MADGGFGKKGKRSSEEADKLAQKGGRFLLQELFGMADGGFGKKGKRSGEEADKLAKKGGRFLLQESFGMADGGFGLWLNMACFG